MKSLPPWSPSVLLMASGANFGFRRTVPHMLGVGLGMPVLVLMVGIGAIQVFERWPLVRAILTVLSVAYLLWLAWKIAHAAAPGKVQATDMVHGIVGHHAICGGA